MEHIDIDTVQENDELKEKNDELQKKLKLYKEMKQFIGKNLNIITEIEFTMNVSEFERLKYLLNE